MAGLAAGNSYFGRLADRTTLAKLRLYGMLEIGIGLFCLLFPTFFGWLSSLYVPLATRVGPTSLAAVLLKILLAAASILVPCAFMGGTLPVLAKYVVTSLSGLGKRIGWLYFINTAGAVFGGLLGGFYVLEAWGLEAGMVGTSLVNLVIGGLFYARAKARAETPAAEAPPSAAPPAEEEGPYTDAQARTALLAITAAGVLSMLYELAWIRLLVLSIGGTVHAFSMMLASFVSGIALGSALVATLLRRSRNALALFGLCEVGIALSVLASVPLYERLPFAFFRMAKWIVHDAGNYGLFLGLQWVLAGLVMLVPTVLIGAALPLASRICVDRIARVGRGVGGVFSMNAVGNVVGAALTGYLLIPFVGLRGTILLGAALSGAIGVVLLWQWRPAGAVRPIAALRDAFAPGAPASGPSLWAAAAGTLVLVAALGQVLNPSWDPRLMQSALYRWARFDFTDWHTFQAQRTKTEILYARDGTDASILVEEEGRFNRTLRVNGKPDASSYPDMRDQLMVAHAPLFIHPAPRTVFVVGLGSGVSAAAALRHPGVTADVAEILPDVVSAAEHFEKVNDGVLRDPRMRLSVLDAREHLLLSRTQYDVIVSEPTNVWIPGVSSLFTQDFYRLVDRRLAPGGVFSQWIQLYGTDEAIVDSMVASLRSVFPHITIWSATEGNIVFIASREPPPFDPAGFAARFRAVAPARGYEHLGAYMAMVADPLAFLSTQVASNEAVRAYWPDGVAPAYRDMFPRLEFAAARAHYRSANYPLLDEFDERVRRRSPGHLYVEGYLARQPMDAAGQRSLESAFRLLGGPFARLADSLAIDEWTRGSDPAVLDRLPGDAAAALVLSREFGAAIDRGAATPELCGAYFEREATLLRKAASVFARPSAARLEPRLATCRTRFPEQADRFALAVARGMADADVETALERLQAAALQAPSPDPRERAGVASALARLQFVAGHPAEAARWIEEAARLNPTDLQVRRLALALRGAAR
jgi:spermidine synthase